MNRRIAVSVLLALSVASCGKAACQFDALPNPAECPAIYTAMTTACPKAGLHCAYPGAGDVVSNGCGSTAVLDCVARDAGSPTWTFGQ
jgi:hypothetical protein